MICGWAKCYDLTVEVHGAVAIVVAGASQRWGNGCFLSGMRCLYVMANMCRVFGTVSLTFIFNCWAQLEVTVIPPEGPPRRRSVGRRYSNFLTLHKRVSREIKNCFLLADMPFIIYSACALFDAARG